MKKILVIEDESILRGEVQQWLMLEGYEVQTAENGIAGVEAAFRQLPDLIVCDISMPRLDGYGVLLEMRSNPSTTEVPFIFVTARASHEDIRRGMQMGADDYITKPFTRLELLDAISARLRKKEAQEQHFQQEVAQWQQAFEQEREQRQLKSKLVAMFSHDFRNSLASILSSNSLLRDYANRVDEERRLVHFNRIEASVRQLLQMLDDMLVVAQIESGRFEFKPEQMNIHEYLQGITDEYQITHGDTHTIVFEYPCTKAVMADPRLLRQIADNLISNAIKYSPAGTEVRISLSCPDGEMILKVLDQGVGIPEADQPGLFTAFQRASNVGKTQGTGLGLAIVKQAVDIHGGSIALESRIGQGTSVTVRIPM